MTTIKPVVDRLRTVPAWAWDCLACLGVLLVAGVWVSWRWLDLFPLIEFRQQSFFDFSLSWLWDQITLEGPNFFPAAFSLNSVLGNVCGTNVACENASLLGVNLVTAALLFALVRRIGLGRWLAVVATTVWLVSEPVLDTMTWQATNLDKLAALSVLLGLHVGLTLFRRPFTWWGLALANVVLFVVAVFAHNTKPAAWVLVPMLFLLPLIGGGQRITTWWPSLVLPTLYGAAQVLHVRSLVAADPFYSAHVTAGDVRHNLSADLGYLGGMLNGSQATTIAAAAVVAVVVMGLVRRSPHARLALFFLIGTAGALLIPARSVYPAPFYMMVPGVLAAVLVVVVAVVAWESAPVTVRPGLLVLGFVILGLYGLNVATARDHYAPLAQMSDNFRAALPVIAAAVDRDSTDGLVLRIDQSNEFAYRFAPQDVEQYIWGTKSGFDTRIVTSPPASATPLKGGAVATFDHDLRLTGLVVNGHPVAVPAGG